MRRSIAGAPPLPSHPRICEVDLATLRPHDLGFIRTTACWRRYIGEWALREGRLYLVRITGRYELIGEPLFADWVTQVLRVPMSRARARYVHAGFATRFVDEMHLSIVGGVEVARELVHYTPEEDWE